MNLKKLIVVTGASGFLGSWVVRALFYQDVSVIALVRKNSDCWRLEDMDGLKILREDVGDWSSVILSLRPTVVIAGDWQGVERKDRLDLELQARNIDRSIRIAEASKRAGVEVYIAFGSQAEMRPKSMAIGENEIEKPASPYGEVKVQLHHKLSNLFENSSVRFVWARVFSIYGPLDVSSGMLPTLMHSLLAEEVFEATQADQTWSYLYASDFTAAVLRMIEASTIEGVVNVGHPVGRKVREAIDIVANLANGRNFVNFSVREVQPDQSLYLVPLTTKLLESGWEPEVSLEIGLKNTVNWFQGKNVNSKGRVLPQFPGKNHAKLKEKRN